MKLDFKNHFQAFRESGITITAKQALVYLLCRYAYLIRMLRRPLKIANNGQQIKTLHVTCSFDIGGTQRQIMYLCEGNKNETLIHRAIETFPEFNYLYRDGVTVDENRYMGKNRLTKRLGRDVLSTVSRAPHVVQIYKLVCDFKAERPDIVVGWGHEIAMLTFVAASIAKVPKIVFCIRTFNPFYYGRKRMHYLLTRAHKHMIPLVDGIIVNSTDLRRDYSSWMRINEDAIYVCPNGIACCELSENERLNQRKRVRGLFGIPDDAIVIINIGRLSKEKGQMILVKAFQALLDKFPDRKIYCLLCGDGSSRSEIEDYVNAHRLNKVILCGRVEDVGAYLNASDIFVMPSDFEGMPNAMMEAMAYGLACISTNRSGALDVARDNLEALYVNAGSVEELRDRLNYLIEREDERLRLGINARERIKEFSVDKMISQFNSYLAEVIK